MEFFELEPEVAGGFGDDIEIDHSTTPLTVTRMHYEIETWRGGELLTTFPVYVVTGRLRDAVDAAGLTGVRWDVARVTVEEVQGVEHMAEKGQVLPPEWVWLVPTGTAGVDDIGLARPGELIVSQRAVDVLAPFLGVDHDLMPWPPVPDDDER